MSIILLSGLFIKNKTFNNKTFYHKDVQALLGDNSWSDMWLKFGQQKYPYDDNFRSVSNYALNNDIL